MTLSLDPELQKFIVDRVKSGSYSTPEDVIRSAFAVLRRHEEYGNFGPGELDELLAEGEESIKREGTVGFDEVFANLQQRSAEWRASRKARTTEVE